MTVNGRLRIGVVGTSSHVANTHLTYLASYPRAELAAVCGRNADRTAATAARFGIPVGYTDFADMLDRGKLDAVVIGSPDDLHSSMALAALDHGLHVLCEKPLARTTAEAQAMYCRAEDAGVKHMTNFSWRWLPAQRYARALIDQGWIGKPFDCTIVFRGGYGRDSAYAWRFDTLRGDGVLGDLGSHAFDLARWYVGEIRRVATTARAFIARDTVGTERAESASDSALTLVDFLNGAHGVVVVSAVSHLGEREMEQRIRIHGERGTLEVDYTKPGSAIRYAGATDGEFQTLRIPEQFAGSRPEDPFAVFEELSVGDRFFVDAILDDLPISPSFEDGVEVQRVLDAAREAGRTGHWVDVDARSTGHTGGELLTEKRWLRQRP